MRSLQLFLLVIWMMTLSAANVVAQKSITIDSGTPNVKSFYKIIESVPLTYVDDDKPPIPDGLVGDYLANGKVEVVGERKIVGYDDWIFSVKTEQLKEVWEKSNNGVVYTTLPLLGKQIAWWMILAIIGIAVMFVAQMSKKTFAVVATAVAAVVAFVATITAADVVATITAADVVANATTTTTATTATAAALVANAVAATTATEKPYIYYTCMVVYMVLMYFAF